MNDASQYLQTLARRNAQPYIAFPNLKAIILTGSSAEGVSDYYSDIDMILYYDELPPEETLLAAYQQNHGEDRKLLGERSEGAIIEVYQVQGVECQFEHTTIAAWERDMATVLEQLDVTSPIQKALSGMLEVIPLYGEPLIQEWQARIANYPEPLAEAMVKHYLNIFPIWGIQERMESRDATLWLNQLLVEGSYNILGILSALNHLYFSTFQFKRMHRFIAQMHIAPTNLADRIEALFSTHPSSSATQLEELVRETIELVEQYMPQIDTTTVKKRVGWRQDAWQNRRAAPRGRPQYPPTD